MAHAPLHSEVNPSGKLAGDRSLLLQPPLWQAPPEAALPLLQEAPPSQDILVFLTGQEEIEAMSKTCRDIAKHLPDGCPPMLVLPLYASLPYAQQLRVFQAAPKVSTHPACVGPSPGTCGVGCSGTRCASRQAAGLEDPGQMGLPGLVRTGGVGRPWWGVGTGGR